MPKPLSKAQRQAIEEARARLVDAPEVSSRTLARGEQLTARMVTLALEPEAHHLESPETLCDQPIWGVRRRVLHVKQDVDGTRLCEDSGEWLARHQTFLSAIRALALAR